MEKLISTCIALIACCGLHAQTIKPAVGLNFTDWSKNPSTGEVKSRAGWQLGGSIAFGKKFYVEPGVFYVGKATEFVSESTQIEDIEADINGIRVPVAVGVSLVGDEKTMFGLRVFGGPSAFFITNVGNDLDKDDLEKTNFGLFAGVGFDIWKAFVDASYEWSLTNVQKEVSAIDVGKSRSIFISAGVRLNLKSAP